MTPDKSTYSITKDKNGFSETCGSWRQSFGYYDRYFGCWSGPSPGTLKPDFPDWPLIESDGNLHWSAGSIERDGCNNLFGWDAAELDRARYERRAALHDYARRIPYDIRLTVGFWPNRQWPILQLAGEIPTFFDFLRSEKRYGTQHYVLACLAAASDRLRNRRTRREFAYFIMSEKRQWVLEALYGVMLPKSAARHLRWFHLDALDQLPHPCIHLLTDASDRAVLKDLGTANISAVLALSFEGAESISPYAPGDPEVVLNGKPVSMNVENLDLYHPYRPTIPRLPDGSRFRVLASSRSLKKESWQMQNCVQDFADEVREGENLFLSWHGPERATVKFVLEADGWHFEDALGKENGMLRESSYAQLLADLHDDLPELVRHAPVTLELD